jgi:uncharacterized protein YecE (DUF72 family)
VYERWAASVPVAFRFSAKLPKSITHEKRLHDCEDLLADFLAQVSGLGPRLGCLLVQLPPSLAFDATLAAEFFALVRRRHTGALALEPRHASWFELQADGLLRSFEVARVLADPVRHPPERSPGGWPGLVYLRLHGSPRMYYSAYDDALLQALAQRIRLATQGADAVWCIFDNTASGAATGNALSLAAALQEEMR